jgi:predicted Fe-Mo cluster-binding NifX family protein
MKIVVSAVDRGPDAQVDPRFGRAPWFVVYESEEDGYESVENPHRDMQSGAGIQAAQLALDLGAVAVVTGRCGPNAFETLRAGGVSVHSGARGTVREAIEAHRAGSLAPAVGPSSPGHVGSGTGAGGGRGGGGRGRGPGRGAGQGRGRGRGRD